MYRELASLIDDNDFLTKYDLNDKTYLIIAKPDNEYMYEIVEERSNNKEN